jgi:hypothetical protein
MTASPYEPGFETMATISDTQRAAIRERKRQAQLALRERHQRQEAAQTAAFSAFDRLVHQLDRAITSLADGPTDPLERAATVAAIGHQLATDITSVRAAATEAPPPRSPTSRWATSSSRHPMRRGDRVKVQPLPHPGQCWSR